MYTRRQQKQLGLNDRSVAKEINFAICFGMGAAGLCRKINQLKQDQGRYGFHYRGHGPILHRWLLQQISQGEGIL